MRTAGLLFGFVATLSLARLSQADDTGVTWTSILDLGVEGRAFSDVEAPFDRLPARAKEKVREAVWSLSRHSAGMCTRFKTDASRLSVKWTLTSDRLEMPHMPATGVSGLDLYVRHEGAWRWVANAVPKAKSNEVELFRDLPPQSREFLLYLPLYNGVSAVEIGVPSSAKLEPAPAYAETHAKPIVFYGTSITHGACASRPGMVHTAILGRRLDRPVVNLGFSGNGRMELEVAEFLAEIDASVYVIDCLPNMSADDVKQRTELLVKFLREKRPLTPILLVEDRSYSDGFFITSKRDRNLSSRAELKAAYERLLAEGVKQLGYLEGEHLLGEDNEGTVDSSHPTDLGFFRQADAFEPALRSLLPQ